MVKFIYGQSVMYYDRDATPTPKFIYGNTVLNYEYVAATGGTPIAVYLNQLRQQGVI